MRRGLPAFTVVGLPDASVREARERVRSALLNSGLEFPLQRITANLAPASVRKAGPSFDLALAVAVLVAGGQVPGEALGGAAVCGELSLSGPLRPVRGMLASALAARACGYARVIVPEPNAAEAALAEGLEVLPVPDMAALVDLLHGRRAPTPAVAAPPEPDVSPTAPDLAEVRGQRDAKRGLEIAAAGGHNLLMVGPPGAGKTMLARRMPGILPPPDFDEALDITRVHSVAGLGEGALARERPFRSPHHTISPSGPRRRRSTAAAGRDHARPPRGSLPRRARRVLATCARGAAPAAGGRPGRHRPRPAVGVVPRARGARRRVQPVSVRQERGRLPVWRAGPGAVPAAPERAPAGPDRHRLPGDAAAGPGAGRRKVRHGGGIRGRQGSRGRRPRRPGRSPGRQRRDVQRRRWTPPPRAATCTSGRAHAGA